MRPIHTAGALEPPITMGHAAAQGQDYFYQSRTEAKIEAETQIETTSQAETNRKPKGKTKTKTQTKVTTRTKTLRL